MNAMIKRAVAIRFHYHGWKSGVNDYDWPAIMFGAPNGRSWTSRNDVSVVRSF